MISNHDLKLQLFISTRHEGFKMCDVTCCCGSLLHRYGRDIFLKDMGIGQGNVFLNSTIVEEI